jgi:hypothetical protein
VLSIVVCQVSKVVTVLRLVIQVAVVAAQQQLAQIPQVQLVVPVVLDTT